MWWKVLPHSCNQERSKSSGTIVLRPSLWIALRKAYRVSTRVMLVNSDVLTAITTIFFLDEVLCCGQGPVLCTLHGTFISSANVSLLVGLRVGVLWVPPPTTCTLESHVAGGRQEPRFHSVESLCASLRICSWSWCLLTPVYHWPNIFVSSNRTLSLVSLNT